MNNSATKLKVNDIDFHVTKSEKNLKFIARQLNLQHLPNNNRTINLFLHSMRLIYTTNSANVCGIQIPVFG